MGTVPFCSPTGLRGPTLSYFTGLRVQKDFRKNNTRTNNTTGEYVIN